ncbi:MAG: hypothetical protein ACI8RZ_007466 [Myxococcota bacterium]|jgi:hypothetical protein
MRVKSILLLPLFFCCTSCSSSKDMALGADEASDTGMADTTNESDTGSADTDTAIFVEPMWWRLSASMTLYEGVPLPEKSSLLIELLDGEDESLCVQEVALEGVEKIEPTNDVIVSWWQLTPTASDHLCGVYDFPLPGVIRIGIGEMHPDIFAAANSLSTIDAEAPLNAAYASISDDGQIYVYGVAGTPEAYEGLGEVAVADPLSDGLWQLKPVYRFSF